jgi:hypothetical protein
MNKKEINNKLIALGATEEEIDLITKNVGTIIASKILEYYKSKLPQEEIKKLDSMQESEEKNISTKILTSSQGFLNLRSKPSQMKFGIIS